MSIKFARQNGVVGFSIIMEHESINNQMLQSFKQFFDSRTLPDTMSHLVLSTVFAVSLIGTMVLVLLSSYLNLQCAPSFFKTNNLEDPVKTTSEHFGTSVIWRGRQKTALNPGKSNF